MRMWTRKILVLAQMHYWDRICLLNFSSVQRSEHFMNITYFKIVSGFLPAVEGFKVKEGRNVIEAILPWLPSRTQPWVKVIRNKSFHMILAKLFNSTPSWVCDRVGKFVQEFKRVLNKGLIF